MPLINRVMPLINRRVKNYELSDNTITDQKDAKECNNKLFEKGEKNCAKRSRESPPPVALQRTAQKSRESKRRHKKERHPLEPTGAMAYDHAIGKAAMVAFRQHFFAVVGTFWVGDLY